MAEPNHIPVQMVRSQKIVCCSNKKHDWILVITSYIFNIKNLYPTQNMQQLLTTG